MKITVNHCEKIVAGAPPATAAAGLDVAVLRGHHACMQGRPDRHGIPAR